MVQVRVLGVALDASGQHIILLKPLGEAASCLERAAKAGDRASCQDGLGPLAVEIQRAQAEIGLPDRQAVG